MRGGRAGVGSDWRGASGDAGAGAGASGRAGGVLVPEGVDFHRGMERVGFDGDALGWLQIID